MEARPIQLKSWFVHWVEKPLTRDVALGRDGLVPLSPVHVVINSGQHELPEERVRLRDCMSGDRPFGAS